MRIIITLKCDEEDCGMTYHTTKNKKTTSERLKLKKYCKKCRRHTNYTETK
ncbi:MAG: 50S ribosomal protein L33 [bacterium]|nr:50S ribosomal protein L33 [bacterium]